MAGFGPRCKEPGSYRLMGGFSRQCGNLIGTLPDFMAMSFSHQSQGFTFFMWKQRVVKWTPLLAFYLFWPAMGVVILGEINPNDIERVVWDKLLHFIAYFGLAGIGTVAFEARKTSKYIVLGLIALGGLLELVQGFIGRDMSIYDEVANSLGALCGFFAGWLLLRNIAEKAR